MKKIFLLLLLTSFVRYGFAQQKFAYVDAEYILKHIPEYKSSQKQIEDLSLQWQQEIDKKFQDIDNLYKAYQAEQVLLTDEMKKRREQEIADKEKAAKDYQKQKFGFEGDLFKRRQELIKPIQDKVFETIQKFAEEKNYGIIFDKGSDLIMLYSNPKLDVSDDIITRMGYKAGDIISDTKPSKSEPNKKNK